ncbi:MAG: nucleotidyltransferase domain-containing protein [Candidatus Micrarchaeota archaeon]
MVQNQNLKIMGRFAQKVKKDYSDAKIYLFGSRAGKDFLKTSDFDVLIVSQLFEQKPFFRRASKMYDYWDNPSLLEAFCYTPAELEAKKNQIGFVQNALKTSVKIQA